MIYIACAYLLCGEVGCGKTTYAKAWEERTGGFVLSCDDLMLTLFDTCIGPERHQAMSARCKSFLYEQALSLLRKGMDVMLDFGYWSRTERMEARRFFIHHGFPVQLIHLHAEPDVITTHLALRNRAVENEGLRAYHIDAEKRARFHAQFEPPQADEVDQFVLISS